METIGTLINNLKTKFDEHAGNDVLLKLAREIIAELENKAGVHHQQNDISIPTLEYQNQNAVANSSAKKMETNEQQETKSLNDILKEEKTEISQVLENTPVQDLRRAININDRFVFISELFEKNEGLYEQSIKILNHINNLNEAENWIAQELKIKLNWDDENETVQQFYKLIRRKYSS